MDVSVSVYQCRRGRTIQWTLIGVPDQLKRTEIGRSATKIQQRTIEKLRRSLRSLDPRLLPDIQLVVGRKLVRPRLEMNIRGAGSRRRLSGTFPVIMEPRTTGRGTEMFAFHPQRDTRRVPIDPNQTLEEQLVAFFQHDWSTLDEDDLEALKSDAKDSLRTISFRFTPKTLADSLEKKKKPAPGVKIGARRRRPGQSLIAELGSNATQRAIDELLDPGVSRSPWRAQLQHLLCGADKRSVVLVGPPGVGKSTLVHGLIHDLLEVDEYPTHQNIDRCHTVWQLRGRRIIAGMSYVGQWEQRCVELLDEARPRPRKKGVLLWVDDLHAWGHIGETRESDRALATFFRGPVARRELTIIGESTPEQWQQLQDDAPTFAQTFTTLHVEPPTAPETMRLLVNRGRKIELQRTLAIDARAYRTLYELGGSLFPSAAYPGKVLDLLDALGSSRPEPSTPRHLFGQLEPPSRGPENEVGPAAVIELLSRRTGMPKDLLSPKKPLEPEAVERQLSKRVMGQPAAVRVACDLVMRIKCGLTDPARPFGVYLFSGPTGTGKTELTKVLAEYLYGDAQRLVRLDMSEYNTPGSAARLIGDRWRPQGVLTRRVRAQPFCVVLLDEVEKADPSVLNLMLQLFDDGRLTDANGEVADFRHAVVVMTSNLGARHSDSIGFGGDLSPGERARDVREIMLDIEQAIREFFPPELFNRIDRVVPFNPLDEPVARAIARRELELLLRRRGLVERSIFCRYTESLLDKVVERGFSPTDGARSLKRYLEDEVGAALALHLSASSGAQMRQIWLYLRPGEPDGTERQLALHEEAMREAPPATTSTRFETLLSRGLEPLLREVPRAVEALRALETDGRVETLATTIQDHLARFNRRTSDDPADDADAVFDLDAMRDSIRVMREELQTHLDFDPRLAAERARSSERELEGEQIEAERFSTTLRPRGSVEPGLVALKGVDRRAIHPLLPLNSREALLWRLSEAYFLVRALRNDAPDPRAHVVFLELTQMGPRPPDGRGLLLWLTEAYMLGRGEAVELAVADARGKVVTFDEFAELYWSVALRDARRVVLKLVGVAVHDFFAADQGCHVRDSNEGPSEVVRVRVLDGGPADDVHSVIAGQERQAIEFAAALERGSAQDLPKNPDAVLPIVRRFLFDPPAPSSKGSQGVTSLEVEDYRSAWATTRSVKRLQDVLPSLWILGLGASMSRDGSDGMGGSD